MRVSFIDDDDEDNNNHVRAILVPEYANTRDYDGPIRMGLERQQRATRQALL
jgi:hypothetical protein